MAELMEYMPSKLKALSSNPQSHPSFLPIPPPEKKKERKKKSTFVLLTQDSTLE
jgi:hypothetical protein